MGIAIAARTRTCAFSPLSKARKHEGSILLRTQPEANAALGSARPFSSGEDEKTRCVQSLRGWKPPLVPGQ